MQPTGAPACCVQVPAAEYPACDRLQLVCAISGSMGALGDAKEYIISHKLRSIGEAFTSTATHYLMLQRRCIVMLS